jgi:hypothetical protein
MLLHPRLPLSFTAGLIQDHQHLLKLVIRNQHHGVAVPQLPLLLGQQL